MSFRSRMANGLVAAIASFPGCGMGGSSRYYMEPELGSRYRSDSLPRPEHPFELRWRLVLIDRPGWIL